MKFLPSWLVLLKVYAADSIAWIRIQQILVFESGSAKICGSTDPDQRGKIATKNCKNFP